MCIRDRPNHAFPTAAELDSVVPDRPALLSDKSGHAAWANTLALRLAGITAATADPPGGQIQRDPDGAPTGVFFEDAIDLVASHIPRATTDELVAAMRAAQAYCWSVGLTGLHDFDGRDCFVALQSLREAGELGLRVVKNVPVYRLQHALGVGLRTLGAHAGQVEQVGRGLRHQGDHPPGLGRSQQSDGSWKNYSPVNSTGLAGPLFPVGSEQATKATAYVVSQQLDSGALSTGVDDKANLLATQQGMFALTGHTYASVGSDAAPSASPTPTAGDTTTAAPSPQPSAPAAPTGTDPAVGWTVGALLLLALGGAAVVAARNRTP